MRMQINEREYAKCVQSVLIYAHYSKRILIRRNPFFQALQAIHCWTYTSNNLCNVVLKAKYLRYEQWMNTHIWRDYASSKSILIESSWSIWQIMRYFSVHTAHLEYAMQMQTCDFIGNFRQPLWTSYRNCYFNCIAICVIV